MNQFIRSLSNSELSVIKTISSYMDEHELELVNIQYKGIEGIGACRLFVDTKDPATSIDLDTIAELHKYVNSIFDASIAFEVSSPGIDRPLTTPDSFWKAVGSKVKIKVVGMSYEGILVNQHDGGCAIKRGSKVLKFKWDDIKEANIIYQFPGQK